jgi:hypothetical protein
MDNQHKHIKGYRDLTPEEIGLMNDLKVMAENVGTAVEILRRRDGLDQRWVSIGETHLQQGFMALVRAIAQPTTF